MSDHLIRFMTRDNQFRILVADCSRLCETARQLHDTDPTATVALSRLTTGAALLGGLLKGHQRLAIAIEGNGPLQKLHAETDANGFVRCSVKNPQPGLPPRNDRFDISGAIGRAGFLHVIKDLGLKEPYRGMVQLQTSEIGDDLAYYLTTSEQVPSSVSLGVQLDRNAAVKIAGGFIIQALPGCEDSAVAEIEARLADLPPLAELIGSGDTPKILQDRLFSGIDCTPTESIPLQFRCNCSRQQVAKMLKGLGSEELTAMVNENVPASISCEYCRQTYSFSPEELAGLSG